MRSAQFSAGEDLPEEGEHPGHYVRRAVFEPKGLTVTEAAKLLGVGRPALSNFLNEKAALSADMAVRLEKSFGLKRDNLLQAQAAYDEAQNRERAGKIAVRTYAPSLMGIRAAQLTSWATNDIRSRQSLPGLLRCLIQSTCAGLTHVDFPAFDNAERPGWDGQVESDAATPWIPVGISGWEFGCNQNPRAKAESDFKKRVAGIAATQRQNVTFVFVTPHNWVGKDDWAKEKRAQKKWKDVRVFDASDLEQWLEQSMPAQAWMAEELGLVTPGIQSLKDCWRQWAHVTDPPLSGDLFRSAVELYNGKIDAWLRQPPNDPFVIKAPSREEGLAFVTSTLESIGSKPREYYDRAIAIRTVEGLRKLAPTATDYIAILASPEVEAESAGLHRTRHTIIIRTRDGDEVEPNISLDLVDDKTFRSALLAMGLNDDDIPRLARESGQSATVLRRRLSNVPAIKVPPWAQSKEIARRLVPLCLVGAWDADTKADQEILRLLAGVETYQKVEETVAELLSSEQTPVWMVARHRGVVSKIDALYAIHPFITAQDLSDFFFTARYVLSEKDPALELPEDKRLFASLYGKSRNHSRALRDGICETLVLLAVHGPNMFREKGINVESEINEIVRALLTPLDTQTWASQQNDLPLYAEAAPETFIDILEQDLKSNDPQVLALLSPASSGLFGNCPRAGLLWALEGLAWRPERLLPVARILARLSQQKIEDNWVNKPEQSLEALFSSWIPQTAATIGERLAALEALKKQFPKVVWWICMEQLDEGSRTGSYSCRPRWRNDAFGAGQFAPQEEIIQTCLKAFDIAINWPTQDERTLSDLVERLQNLPDDAQKKVFDLVRDWASRDQDEAAKAMLRERVRQFAFTRRTRARKVDKKLRRLAQDTYDLLEPKDVVKRHQWLFAQDWVNESLEELESEEFDVQKHEEKVRNQRKHALQEVLHKAGYDGILQLCESGETSFAIGWLLGDIIKGPNAIDFACKLASELTTRSPTKIDLCLYGFLRQFQDEPRGALIRALLDRFGGEGERGTRKTIRVLSAAPFRQTTWVYVEALSPDLQRHYWAEVMPQWDRQTDSELRGVIDQLLAVERPRAALNVVHMNWEAIDTPRFVRLLREVATSSAEPKGHYRTSSHEISRALDILDKRSDISRDELAQLEFIYLQALDHTKHGIPNLERQLTESPNLFVQAIGLTFKRNDGAEDTVEGLPPSADGRDTMVTQMYTLLTRLKRSPGTQQDGTIDADKLRKWVQEVRTQCKACAREDVGDRTIGGLLAHCKTGADGVWPCEPVRQVLEEAQSKDIARGMLIGIHNARGPTWRGVGGQQERDIAAKYRGWSKELALEFPFTSRVLEEIAKSFDQDAQWHDSRESLRRRLPS